MREHLHMRVFELKGAEYRLCNSFTPLEEYVMQELQNGYVITDMTNFGVEKLRVTTYYSPGTAKKYLDAGGMMSNLADAPADEV